MRPIAAFATALLLALSGQSGQARDAGSSAAPDVLDLQVGLAQNVAQPTRNPWQGMGQAGIVQLRQGHVGGLIASYRAEAAGMSSAQLAVSFARFRSAVASTQAFDNRACTPAAARISIWYELDAPDVLAAEPDEVMAWVLRGVRVFRLAGRQDSALGSSAFPSGPARATGLTATGRRVADAIMRAGALIDVANLSDLALLEVVELAQQLGKPVIATRGSSRAIRSRPGSFTDWQLRAIAATGGVIGISFDSALIGDTRAELADVLRQVEHVARIAGPGAVALSSGFETGDVPPAILSNATRFPRLAEALLAKSVTEEQLRKLFGDNARRVLCR